MLIGQGGCDALDVILAELPVAVAVFLEQHVHHHQLGDLRRDGAELEGAFVGAAAQHHIRQGGGGGFSEPGNQDGADAPLPCQLQQLQTLK